MTMVQIWLAREGREPTPPWKEKGHPFFLGELPLDDAEVKLGLRKEHLYAGLETRGTLGDQSLTGEYAEPRFVVAIIEEHEAAGSGWDPGFYRLSLSPERARLLLH